MPFVVDDLVAWLIGVCADAGRRRLAAWAFGPQQERALRRAALAAVNQVAAELSPQAGEPAEYLAAVIGQVLEGPVSGPVPGTADTLLGEFWAAVGAQLAPLDDASVTNTGQSSAQVLGISASALAEKLTARLVREVISRGSRGGPLEPLASQFNHDMTHLQGQRLEGLVGQLAQSVRESMPAGQPGPADMAQLALRQASAAGYLCDTQNVPDGYIPLGAVRDNKKAMCFMVPVSLIQEGVLIAGAASESKSASTKCLLDKLQQCGVPWFVIEPSEPYEISAVTRTGVITHHDPRIVVMGGGGDFIPVMFNPLEAERGFSLPRHIELLHALFRATVLSGSSEGVSRALGVALRRAYAGWGWNMSSEDGLPAKYGYTRFPSLEDLKNKDRLDGGEQYEVAAGDQGAIDGLVTLLLSGPGRWWLQDGNAIDIKGLLACRASARIANIQGQARGFLIWAMLLRIFEYVKVAAREGERQRLRHVTLIKDASVILPSPPPARESEAALGTLERMLMEMRPYGEGIVAEEQYPAKLTQGILQRSELKIVHRLPGSEDAQAAGAALGLGQENLPQLKTLKPGHALVLAKGMDKPIEVRLQLSTLFRIL